MKEYNDQIKIQQKHISLNCFVVRVLNRNAWQALKVDANVVFVDHHKNPTTESSLDHVNTSFNRIRKVHRLLPEVNGTDQNISIKEQLFDTTNIDLVRRSFVTPITPSIVSQHATAMAVLIAGAGNSSGRTKGVAPQARFTSSDFNNLFPDDVSIFSLNNLFVQNHSYGVDIENYYGNEAFAYDQQVYQNPLLLHVFSAGNLGMEKPLSGRYQDMSFANLSGNFKQAKNILVVNAVDTTLTLNANNSRGPTFDGRIKPELTAYGQGGTSDAAALTSGVVLLVQEKYQALYNKHATASMVKAILIATADDIGPSGIDYLYGYGSVNAYNALTLVEFNQMVSVDLTSNGEVSIPIVVPNSIAELTIAITWTDPPAIPNSNQVLVNDIDSRLEDGANVMRPWVLSDHPNADSLLAAPTRKMDHLNNTEYITLDNPSGLYQLKLSAGELGGGEQNVSVAYWLKENNKFEWDFPLLKDIVGGGEKNLLVWTAQPDQLGTLYYQVNEDSWRMIASNVDLNQYLYWMAPDTMATTRLKMRIGSDEFVSDEFMISPILQLKSAFVCTDSIGLTWNSMENATGYDFYGMGSRTMEKIGTTTDTLMVLAPASYKYFAVTPVVDEISGFRSETINYTQQGTSCYMNLFDAQRFNATQIKIQLSVSSLHDVTGIKIFRTTDGVRTIFKNLSADSQLQFEWYDSDLVPGTLVYQAQITFTNGIKVLSEIAEVTIEEKGEVIIYPNPVSNDTGLTILSAGGARKFIILDALGKYVMGKELYYIEESLDLTDLPPGMYFYQLFNQERVTDSGKLVKY